MAKSTDCISHLADNGHVNNDNEAGNNTDY